MTENADPKEVAPLTNSTQLQTTGAAVIGIAAGFLAGKGYLGLSLTDWTTILTALVGVGTVLWPAIATRANALKNTVGNLPKTTVVTDAASAAALPANNDVIAATPEIIAAIKKAS